LIQRPGAQLAIDLTPSVDAETGDIIDWEALVDADQSDCAHEAGRDGNERSADASGNGLTLGNKPKSNHITVSNARTHNDMLFVTCCGLIVCRETFYRAESPKLEMLLRRYPNHLPPIQFYDNGCSLDKHINTSESDHAKFYGTIRPVDPFHLRTHSGKDATCQANNNPN
ncbi:hypothetical protein CROQUDRAFT_696800, partial [Cronartium quercuum f. sp. fusiforme G11]